MSSYSDKYQPFWLHMSMSWEKPYCFCILALLIQHIANGAFLKVEVISIYTY